jgi:hypothetical protein
MCAKAEKCFPGTNNQLAAREGAFDCSLMRDRAASIFAFCAAAAGGYTILAHAKCINERALKTQERGKDNFAANFGTACKLSLCEMRHSCVRKSEAEADALISQMRRAATPISGESNDYVCGFILSE